VIPGGGAQNEARVSIVRVVNNDIETLATALYVRIDDMLADWPDLAQARPATGTPLTLSDAELLAMAVMSALPGSPPRSTACSGPWPRCALALR
jgi:hypothetical protein